MSGCGRHLEAIRKRIRAAERASGRAPGSVRLVAVSKTRSAEDLVLAYRCGQRHFGENYLQEAIEKQRRLAHYDITWHYIGPLQSNKTRPVAERFAWVHSIDRLKIATRLNEQRPPSQPRLDVCVQVNVSGEDTKTGISVEELPDFLCALSELPRLRVRGLMTIPEPADTVEAQRRPLRRLRQALEAAGDAALDTLSMGMTADLEVAVSEGATIVRIGTGIFGARL